MIGKLIWYMYFKYFPLKGFLIAYFTYLRKCQVTSNENVLFSLFLKILMDLLQVEKNSK